MHWHAGFGEHTGLGVELERPNFIDLCHRIIAVKS